MSRLPRPIPVGLFRLQRSFLFISVLVVCWLITNIPPATAAATDGISIEQDRRVKLAPPVGVAVRMVEQDITVTWNPKGLEIVTGYKIFRKEAGQEFNLLVLVSADAKNELNLKKPYRYTDTTADGHKYYAYAVVAVDHYDNESELSAQAEWFPRR